MPKLSLLLLFFLSVAANLYFVETGNCRAKGVTKALLMPLLALYYWFGTGRPDNIVLLALLFSFLGDLALLRSNRQSWLAAGTLAFLSAHICYITVLLGACPGIGQIPAAFFLLSIPYLLFGIWMERRITLLTYPGKALFVVYMLGIFTMSFTALLRYAWTSGNAFWLPFTGSVMFIVSDSLLALHEMKQDRQIDTVIMLTYCAAQFLIVSGFMYPL